MVTLCLQVIRRMEGKLTWLKEPLPVQSRRQSVNPSGEQPFVSGPTANTHTYTHNCIVLTPHLPQTSTLAFSMP